MVVELTSSWTMAEYRMAIARIRSTQPELGQRKSLQLIVVVTDDEQAPASARDLPIIRRPNVISEDPDGFISQLSETLRRLSAQLGVERQAKPLRLLQAKEYRAAVISAMTLLESEAARASKQDPLASERVDQCPCGPLVEVAMEQGKKKTQFKVRLDAWMRLRNEVVHSATAITKAQAAEIVNGVMEWIGRLIAKGIHVPG